jgi:hypothetical protein
MGLRPYAFGVRILLILAVLITGLNLLAIAARFPFFAAAILGFIAWKRARRWQLSTAYGSARPAGLGDLIQRGMIGSRGGLILGTTAYLEPPGKAEALAALVDFELPSSALAVRLFLAGFLGKQWMEN